MGEVAVVIGLGIVALVFAIRLCILEAIGWAARLIEKAEEGEL